jgi:hypothetical protein
MKLDSKKFPALEKILASDPAGVNDELKALKNIKALLQDFFSVGDPVSPDQMGFLIQIGDIADHYANKKPSKDPSDSDPNMPDWLK